MSTFYVLEITVFGKSFIITGVETWINHHEILGLYRLNLTDKLRSKFCKNFIHSFNL